MAVDDDLTWHLLGKGLDLGASRLTDMEEVNGIVVAVMARQGADKPIPDALHRHSISAPGPW